MKNFEIDFTPPTRETRKIQLVNYDAEVNKIVGTDKVVFLITIDVVSVFGDRHNFRITFIDEDSLNDFFEKVSADDIQKFLDFKNFVFK